MIKSFGDLRYLGDSEAPRLDLKFRTNLYCFGLWPTLRKDRVLIQQSYI